MSTKNNQKPILIGLSASVDSFVAAYLLKIQKENLFAVTFLPTQDGFFGCHTSEDDIRKIKKFCDQIQIPHQVLSLETEFLDQVKEPYISSKIEGVRFNPCHNCHQFRLRQLYQQMKTLKMERLATGHMAKVLKSPSDMKVSVSSSPDSEYDQSHYFVSLEPEILNCLELPLSDLQKKDIETLAQNFSLNISSTHQKCLSDKINTHAMLSKEIPVHLCKEGEVYKNESYKVAEHSGVYAFNLAETYITSSQSQEPHPDIVTKIDYTDGSVQLGPYDYFEAGSVLLHYMTFSQKQGQSKPFRGYIHLGTGHMDKEVIVYPKTLSAALVIVVDGTHSFIPGDNISIFKRKGKSSPLLAQGRVNIIFNQKITSEDEDDAEITVLKLEDLNHEHF